MGVPYPRPLMKAYHSYDSLNLGPTELKAKKRGERGAMPRFTVIADGLTMTRQTVYQLDELLGSIYAELPVVFINAGLGVTIDFDGHAG